MSENEPTRLGSSGRSVVVSGRVTKAAAKGGRHDCQVRDVTIALGVGLFLKNNHDSLQYEYKTYGVAGKLF